MHARRPARIALALGLLATAAVLASAAYGALIPPTSPQAMRLGQACTAALSRITTVVRAAASAQPQTIEIPLSVVTPGTLSAKLAFNPGGSKISLAADQSGFGVACGSTLAPSRRLGHGPSRIVSALHQTFAKRGRYVLTFELNHAGRNILARLGAAERAYRKRHPHGTAGPGIAFGAGFTYTPGG